MQSPATDYVGAFDRVWKQTQRDAPQVGPPRTAGEAFDVSLAGLGRLTPGISSGMELVEDAGLWANALRHERGTQTPEDEAALTDWLANAQRPQTAGYKFWSTILEMVPLAGELLAGVGVAGAAGKRLGKAGLGKLVRESLERATARKGAAQLAAQAAKGGLTTAAILGTTGAPRVAAATFQQALPDMALTEDQAGRMHVQLLGDVKGFLEALPEGAADQFIEVATELSGGAIGRGLARVPVLSSVVALESAVIRKAAQKLGGTDAALDLLARTGWRGPIEEVLEEVAGAGARELTPGLEGQLPEWPQIAAIFAMSPAALGGATLLQAGAPRAGAGTTPTGAQGAPGTGLQTPATQPAEGVQPLPPREAHAPSVARLQALGLSEMAAKAFPGARAVEARGEAEEGLRDRLREVGVEAVFFEGSKTGETRPAAMFSEGAVGFASEAITSPERGSELRWHEKVHVYRRRFPDEFESLAAAIETISPPRARQAEQEYTKDFGAELPPDLLREEGVARRVEGLASWLDRASRPEGLAELEKAAAVPSVWRRIVRAIRRMLGLSVPDRGDAMTALEAHKALGKLRGTMPPSRGLPQPRGEGAIPLPEAGSRMMAQRALTPEAAARMERRTSPAAPREESAQEPVDVFARPARRAVPSRAEQATEAFEEGGEFEGVRFAAAPPTNSPEFKRWFGESKVVGSDGEPLVVYHGAPDARFTVFEAPVRNNAEFWFTSSPATANTYADDRRAFNYQDAEPATMPVYLSLQSPLEVMSWDLASDPAKPWIRPIQTAVDRAKANGHDGLIIRAIRDDYPSGGRISDHFVAFRPEQIKSALGNRGTFDPSNPDIRFAAADPSDYELPPERLRDRLGRAIRDRYLRIYQQEERIKGERGEVSSALRRFPGKAGERVQAIRQREFEPLEKHIASNDLDLEDLGLYAYAKTAPGRNALMQSREPDKFDPEEADGKPTGSGMTTSEALAIIANTESGPKGPAYLEAYRQLRRMAERGLDERVADGLLTQEQADAMREAHPEYLPLRTDSGSLSFRRGQGFTVSGEEFKRAGGRGSRADSPVTFTMLQRMEGAIRGEKNIAAQPALRMFEENPNPQLWTVDKKPNTQPLVDEEGQPRLGPKAKIPENVWTIKRNGVEYQVTFDDPLLARALKNLGVEGVPSYLQLISKLTRLVASVNTAWSPEFMLSNLSRDVQTALVHAGGENGVAVARKTLARVLPMMRAAFRVERDPNAQGVNEDRYREMRREGGTISFYGSMSFDSIQEEAQKAVSQFQQKPLDLRRAFRSLVRFVENMNRSIENATRGAFYSVLRENGVEPGPAALAARELTVDFNRKGEMSAAIGALWMFFNAGVGGTARIMRAIGKSKKVRAIVGGIVVSGAMLELLNGALGGDDENGTPWYDKIPDHVKERNWIIMLPGGGGKHVKFPMPYGYNVFHNAGRQAAAVALGKKSPAEAAGRTVAVGFDSFNPLGSAPSLLQFIAPTIVDPAVQIGENLAWYGGPVMPEQNPFEAPIPDSQRAFKTITPVAQSMAETLNWLTGGDELESGMVDVSPESLQLWYDFLTGDVGRSTRRVANLIRQPWRDEPVEMNEIPFVRRVFGEADPRYDRGEFFDNMRDLERVEKRVKLYRERRDLEGLRSYMESNRELVALAKRADDFRKRAKEQRERGDEEAETRTMQRFNRMFEEAAH